MNKTELVAAIAERTELTKKDADQRREDSVSWIRYFRSN